MRASELSPAVESTRDGRVDSVSGILGAAAIPTTNAKREESEMRYWWVGGSARSPYSRKALPLQVQSVCAAADPGAMAWEGLEIDKRRTRRADCCAGGESLHHARDDE
nr:hypothetical protein GCM10017611_81870 [Rhodococcus wratislaviensis]